MTYVEFDADEVMREFGDAEVIAELVGIVRVDLLKYAAGLGAAFTAGDMNEVRRLAHAIKGAAGNLAAREVCTVASTIDNALRAGQTEAAAQSPQLVAACERLERELGVWMETMAQAEDAAH